MPPPNVHDGLNSEVFNVPNSIEHLPEKGKNMNIDNDTRIFRRSTRIRKPPDRLDL